MAPRRGHPPSNPGRTRREPCRSGGRRATRRTSRRDDRLRSRRGGEHSGVFDGVLELEQPAALSARPDAPHILDVESGEIDQLLDLGARDLDRVAAVAPVEMLGDQAVGAVQHQDAGRPEHSMSLEEEAGQFVGPEVLRGLPGKHEIDRPGADVIHVVGGVDDPVDVRREVVRLGLERLHADVSIDHSDGRLEPVEVPASVGADAEHLLGALGHPLQLDGAQGVVGVVAGVGGDPESTDGFRSGARHRLRTQRGASEVPAMISATYGAITRSVRPRMERFRRRRDASTEGIGIRRDYRWVPAARGGKACGGT